MANVFDMIDTWNAAGTTFTAIKMNVTDTASAAASLLMDLQVGGASKFKVSKGGVVMVGDGAAGTPSLSFTGASNKGFYQRSDSAVGMSWGSDEVFHFSQGQVAIGGGWALAFGSGSLASVAADTYLYRDAAGILAQRNGTNAQASRLYFSYTDASNYTRLALKTATGVHTLETESAGTGEANIDLALTPKGTGRVRFGTHSALAAETVTGYITIKDAGGTERKVAVVS